MGRALRGQALLNGKMRNHRTAQDSAPTLDPAVAGSQALQGFGADPSRSLRNPVQFGGRTSIPHPAFLHKS